MTVHAFPDPSLARSLAASLDVIEGRAELVAKEQLPSSMDLFLVHRDLDAIDEWRSRRVGKLRRVMDIVNEGKGEANG